MTSGAEEVLSSPSPQMRVQETVTSTLPRLTPASEKSERMRGSSVTIARGILTLRSRYLLLTDFISTLTERPSVSAHLRLYAVILLNICVILSLSCGGMPGIVFPLRLHIYLL